MSEWWKLVGSIQENSASCNKVQLSFCRPLGTWTADFTPSKGPSFQSQTTVCLLLLKCVFFLVDSVQQSSFSPVPGTNLAVYVYGGQGKKVNYLAKQKPDNFCRKIDHFCAATRHLNAERHPYNLRKFPCDLLRKRHLRPPTLHFLRLGGAAGGEWSIMVSKSDNLVRGDRLACSDINTRKGGVCTWRGFSVTFHLGCGATALPRFSGAHTICHTASCLKESAKKADLN